MNLLHIDIYRLSLRDAKKALYDEEFYRISACDNFDEFM